MYIGSTGQRGLHHLIWEILDNGIDEHLAGFCNQIEVTLLKDGGIMINDHGRGVPVDIHPTKHIPTARVGYTIHLEIESLIPYLKRQPLLVFFG